MSLIDTAGESLKRVFVGAATAYVIAIPVHDIWTGESLIAKTWNSVVVSNLENRDMCRYGHDLHNSFVCKRRGNGKGLYSLLPRR